MAPRYRNPRSTASIAGHPIHPMLIPFPIAFFVATLACDIGFWITGSGGWFEPTLWLLGAGLIMAALAAVAGLTDFLGEAQIRSMSTAWWHAGGNVAVVVIEIVNFFLRYGEGSKAVLPTGIVLSAIVVCGLLFTGWKGWQMVYEGHIGVSDLPAGFPQQPENPETIAVRRDSLSPAQPAAGSERRVEVSPERERTTRD